MTSDNKERASAEVTARVGNLGLELGRFVGQLLNGAGNLFRRRPSLSCKRLNFAGHNRKSPTVVTRSCRFDRRVQCEQIGLARHFLDLIETVRGNRRPAGYFTLS